MFNKIDSAPFQYHKTGSLQRVDAKESTILPQILFITTYPPRECGIATYSHDLIKALNNKFQHSFDIKICALESQHEQHEYPKEIAHVLNTGNPAEFVQLAKAINANDAINMVLIQHEFGLFENAETDFKQFLKNLIKPVVIVFHTVLPHPNALLQQKVQEIAAAAEHIIVMTNASADILVTNYGVVGNKIHIIAHGTHLVPHEDKTMLKHKYNLAGKIVTLKDASKYNIDGTLTKYKG
jgi:glycosyltransferase involved in cell wall biosynthesis